MPASFFPSQLQFSVAIAVPVQKAARREEYAEEREGRTLEGLGITPRSIESIVPSYLYRYRKAGQFTSPGKLA